MLSDEDIDFMCEQLMQFPCEIAARIVFDITEEMPHTTTTVFPYVTHEITQRDEAYSLKMAAAYAQLLFDKLGPEHVH